MVIGETGRAFNTRKKEHLKNTKTAAKGSRIANHAWSNNHAIDFENASVIDKGTFRTRKTLEAWNTTVTPNADNNSCPLPGQYSILFNKYSYFFTFSSFYNIRFDLNFPRRRLQFGQSKARSFLIVLARDRFLNLTMFHPGCGPSIFSQKNDI